MDLRDQRDTYNGFGEGLARAFELAVTPAIFAYLGHLLDRKLGTSAIFTIVGFTIAVIGMFARLWYGYDTQMKVYEADMAKRPGQAPSSHGSPGKAV